jgi:hypothetical protein
MEEKPNQESEEVCRKLLAKKRARLAKKMKMSPEEVGNYVMHLDWRIKYRGGALLPGVEFLPKHCINCMILYILQRRLFYKDQIYNEWMQILQEQFSTAKSVFSQKTRRLFKDFLGASRKSSA